MISHNSPNASSVVHSEEVLGLYQDLMKMDPTHSQYFKDEYSSVLLKKVFFFPNSSCWGESIFFIWSLDSDLICSPLKQFFYRHIIKLIKFKKDKERIVTESVKSDIELVQNGNQHINKKMKTN